MSDLVSVAELRTLFLFERLDDEKLQWLCATGREVSFAPNEVILREGTPAEYFVVLLEGTVALSRNVRAGGEIEVTRTDHRGAYAGLEAFLADQQVPAYSLTMRAITDCRLFQLPVLEFGQAVQSWFPMAMHLVSGIINGMRTSQARVEERERLVALGTLTAGLTHELNNPAAAATRAVAGIRERDDATRQALARWSQRDAAPAQIRTLLELSEPATGHRAATLSPLEVNDREDQLADWLSEHDVDDADDLAAVFVAAGLDTDWAERVVAAVEPTFLPATWAWLAHTVETRTLLDEIEEATGRISELLNAAKQYSQMDRAPQQRADLRVLLASTLSVMRHKIGSGVQVVTEYADDVPDMEVYAAELNQVWTNLIDNALQAMAGSGTLTIRTRLDGTDVVVEIVDTGPGIPEDVRTRIFEPFFTTKPVGEGTGLGLDISRRIVVDRHGGDLEVESRPGHTRFRIRLPVPDTAPS